MEQCLCFWVFSIRLSIRRFMVLVPKLGPNMLMGLSFSRWFRGTDAPWCGHCKTLAPQYAAAAQQLEKKNSGIKLAKVDATEATALAEKFGVRGYPTLKFFRSGSDIEYTGGRTADDIVAWLEKKTGPPAVELTTVEAAEELIKENKVAIIGFFKNRESPEAKAFLAAASAIDDVPFAITGDDALYEKYEAKCGQIVLFKQFDEGKAVFAGDATSVIEIKQFVAGESMPLIVDFNHESAQKIFGGEIKSHLLLFVSKEAGHLEKYAEPAKAIAKDVRNQILFVTINADEEDHQRILEFFGMKKEEVPAMRLIKLEEDMAKYKPPTAELDTDSIRSFVQAFLDNKLKQHLLSQEAPADWNITPVWTLVSSNFDEVAFNADKDVLVEFYAPWCGHCKQLAPIFDQLGEHFADNEAVVVAKIDSTANELEHTKITSFPTLKFYKKGDNQAVDYNGERTLEALKAFVAAGGVESDASAFEDHAELEEPTDDSSEETPNAKDEL